MAPSDDFVRVYRRKLRELEVILNDVHPPAESFKINEKLSAMGRVPLFVSKFKHFNVNLQCSELD